MSETLGKTLYMGMGRIDGSEYIYNMSCGYFEDYALKKALQHERATGGRTKFVKLNFIVLGKTEKEHSIYREELEKKYQHIFKEYA